MAYDKIKTPYLLTAFFCASFAMADVPVNDSKTQDRIDSAAKNIVKALSGVVDAQVTSVESNNASLEALADVINASQVKISQQEAKLQASKDYDPNHKGISKSSCVVSSSAQLTGTLNRLSGNVAVAQALTTKALIVEKLNEPSNERTRRTAADEILIMAAEGGGVIDVDSLFLHSDDYDMNEEEQLKLTASISKLFAPSPASVAGATKDSEGQAQRIMKASRSRVALGFIQKRLSENTIKTPLSDHQRKMFESLNLTDSNGDIPAGFTERGFNRFMNKHRLESLDWQQKISSVQGERAIMSEMALMQAQQLSTLDNVYDVLADIQTILSIQLALDVERSASSN